MDKAVKEKIASCKALQKMTVAELIETRRFLDNLAAYLTAQREDRAAIRASYEAMRKLGGTKGYKLPSHVIDHLSGLSVEEFATEYKRVVSGTCARPRSEREYIRQLGGQAYNLTVAQYVVDEFPELEETLIPKKKAN